MNPFGGAARRPSAEAAAKFAARKFASPRPSLQPGGRTTPLDLSAVRAAQSRGKSKPPSLSRGVAPDAQELILREEQEAEQAGVQAKVSLPPGNLPGRDPRAAGRDLLRQRRVRQRAQERARHYAHELEDGDGERQRERRRARERGAAGGQAR